MSGNVAIRVENIGKRYQLGHVVSFKRTLRETLTAIPGAFTKKTHDAQYHPAQNSSPHPSGKESEYFWALQNINFEVRPGEIVGIIGRNGAGKSTLLKILSRITTPSTGLCRIRGRIVSLLEVGTGFHQELTGRENIYLNGAILGMKKTEIDIKFDEIVAFSGVEKFIDTPVKRYSSGMRVRLAFAVAAHLEPEIMFIDEVLAVGDSEFQKKCLNKMKEISQQERTILFVSHNMSAIQRLCSRAIYLDKGEIKMDGTTDTVVEKYLSSTPLFNNSFTDLNIKNDSGQSFEKTQFTKCQIKNAAGDETSSLKYGEPFTLHLEIQTGKSYHSLACAVGIDSYDGQRIFTSDSEEFETLFSVSPSSPCKISVTFSRIMLMPGQYRLSKLMVRHGKQELNTVLNVAGFEITEQVYQDKSPPFVKSGLIAGQAAWKTT